jgi:cytochrome c553
MRINLVLTRPVLRLLTVALVTLLLCLVLTWLLPWKDNTGLDVATDLRDYSMPWTHSSPFYPAEFKTEGDRLIDWRGIPSATFCGECHQKEFREWASSIHAVSGLDVIYENSISVNEFASVTGGDLATEKVRWCDGCHEPLGTLAGSGTPVPVVGPNEAIEEGTTCIVCHTVTDAQPLVGNAALTLNINTLHRYLNPALIMAAPEEHAKSMQARTHNPLMGSSDMCGACHTEIRPTRVGGEFPVHLQETYDEWRLSQYADQGVQCQDCHMDADPAAYVSALKRGETPERSVSHRFVGSNYLLTASDLLGKKVMELRGGWVPGLNVLISGQEWLADLQAQQNLIVDLLQVAADLSVAAPRLEGTSAHLEVRVTNSGAGHSLPTGALDQRHMWLQVTARDRTGQIVYDNGWFDPDTGVVDPQAVIYIKRMFNEDGALNLRHVLFDIERLEYSRHPIRAGETDRVDYRIPLDRQWAGPLELEVKLWYRLALQEILKNVTEFQLPPLSFDIESVVIPPVLMAQTKVSLALNAPAQTEVK